MKSTSASQGTLVSVSGSIGQQTGGHQRQGGVLGAADGDFALQAGAAFNAYSVHGPSCSAFAGLYATLCNARDAALRKQPKMILGLLPAASGPACGKAVASASLFIGGLPIYSRANFAAL